MLIIHAEVAPPVMMITLSLPAVGQTGQPVTDISVSS